MAWIRIIDITTATVLLKRQYDLALRRAGRVWNVVSTMSMNPNTMKSSMDLYRTIMFGDSPLSRSRREMLAVVVSATNHCVY